MIKKPTRNASADARRHKIGHFEFYDFKSLRNVYLIVKPFMLIVGANGAGKSNLVDAVEFLSDIYRGGLESAFSSLGLYDEVYFRSFDNIADSLKLGVGVHVDAGIALNDIKIRDRLLVSHSFGIARNNTKVTGIPTISFEHISIARMDQSGSSILMFIERKWGGAHTASRSNFSGLKLNVGVRQELDSIVDLVSRKWRISESELLLGAIARLSPLLGAFTETASGISVYEIDPDFAREESPRQFRPRLSRYGENLPSVVSQIKRHSATAWDTILAYMRDIRPQLDDIVTKRSRSGQQMLVFQESSGEWHPHEVSNGTVRSLAALTAIFDPASALVILEEPENSLHPWMARRLIEACQVASKEKEIILTTHSPVVMSMADPNSISVMWNPGDGTRLSTLKELDPDDVALWEAGEIDAFDVINSGVVPEALPQRSS